MRLFGGICFWFSWPIGPKGGTSWNSMLQSVVRGPPPGIQAFVGASNSLQFAPIGVGVGDAGTGVKVGVHTAPTQPLMESQVWHGSHTSGLLPMQTPLWQVSVCVQAVLSSQLAPFGFFRLTGQLRLVPVQFSA